MAAAEVESGGGGVRGGGEHLGERRWRSWRSGAAAAVAEGGSMWELPSIRRGDERNAVTVGAESGRS